MQGIPSEYFPKIMAKISNYSIKIKDVEAKVKTVCIGSTSLLETHINYMRMALKTSPRVVGFDTKQITYYSNTSTPIGESLVLCGGDADFLIIHLPKHTEDFKIPEVLIKFLYDPTICFVRATNNQPLALSTALGVKAGDLAAMVLQEPLIAFCNLKQILEQVGIQYDGLSFGSEQIHVYMKDPIVLSRIDVKLVVSEAYAAYQIGHKLLASL